MNSKEIEKEAKKIMDNFMDAMKDAESSIASNSNDIDYDLVRENCFREEGNGSEVDEEFRQIFLSNARKTLGDAVLANKGDWEK